MFDPVIPAKAGIQPGRSRGFRWAPVFAGVTVLLLASCGFQLRGDPEVGIKKLYISSTGGSQVMTEIKRSLATGPTRIVLTSPEAQAHLHILQETREKVVSTVTGEGRVYEFQLRLAVRYELLVPGRDEPVIAPTEVSTRRLVTYSQNAPTAKDTEEQLLYKDMQKDLARQILLHVAAMKAEI